jgi:hypothetical protein
VIEKVVTRPVLKRRWKSLGRQLRSQLFLDVVEFKDIDAQIDEIAKSIELQVHDGSYRPAKPTHYLVEKSRGLCRQMTQSEPRDLLVLETLTNSLKKELVENRPSKRAFFEPDQQRFARPERSFGVDEYSSIKPWKDFQQAIFAFSRERNFIVVTDVANFYDFISFKHLRNIISSICEVREPLLDLLIFVLNEMSWTPDYMPRSEVGLPQMESNAPRVLANAMLYELDRVAEEKAFGEYVRYMDDIDVGVDTIAKAKETVRDIDLTLQSRQLRLNASKTKILTRTEAYDHFCIRENRFLDFCSESIARSGVKAHAPVRRALAKAYLYWRGKDLRNSRFTRGNGDKIFKYLAKVGGVVGYEIPSVDLITLIKLHPSLRLTAFTSLSRQNHPNAELYQIRKMFEDQVFLDDFSVILTAKFCIHARFRADTRLKREIRQLIHFFEAMKTEYATYAALIIGSKFLDATELTDLVSRTFDRWKDSFWLGRTVGGLTPICGSGAATSHTFFTLLQKADNRSALEVYDFHMQLQTDRSKALRLLKYATAPNDSYAQGIIHPKALIIKSLSLNSSFNAETKKIVAAQPALRSDPFYRLWGL